MLRRKRFWFAIMAILPTFAIFGWVRLFPIIETLRLSMHEWNLLSKNKPFVGFKILLSYLVTISFWMRLLILQSLHLEQWQ